MSIGRTVTELYELSIPAVNFDDIYVFFIDGYVESHRGTDRKIEIFSCPTCRSDFTLQANQNVAELTSSYFIKNMLEIMSIQQKAKRCSACSRCTNPAISHCTSCEMFLCSKCSESHDSWPSNKNHSVLLLREMNNDEQSQAKKRRKLFCLKHENELLKYYCETCKELVCTDCFVLNHQKPNHMHSCQLVSEAAEKGREVLQSNCATFDGKVSEGKDALKNISEVMKILEKNAKNTKDEIRQQKVKILNIIAEKLDEKEKEMIEEINNVFRELQEELNEQHDEIKHYLKNVQASESFAKNLLKRGSIEEILASQKLIHKNIEKFTNGQPTDMTAVNDGDIHYVPDDIGNMNVDDIVNKLGFVEGM